MVVGQRGHVEDDVLEALLDVCINVSSGSDGTSLQIAETRLLGEPVFCEGVCGEHQGVLFLGKVAEADEEGADGGGLAEVGADVGEAVAEVVGAGELEEGDARVGKAGELGRQEHGLHEVVHLRKGALAKGADLVEVAEAGGAVVVVEMLVAVDHLLEHACVEAQVAEYRVRKEHRAGLVDAGQHGGGVVERERLARVELLQPEGELEVVELLRLRRGARLEAERDLRQLHIECPECKKRVPEIRRIHLREEQARRVCPGKCLRAVEAGFLDPVRIWIGLCGEGLVGGKTASCGGANGRPSSRNRATPRPSHKHSCHCVFVQR